MSISKETYGNQVESLIETISITSNVHIQLNQSISVIYTSSQTQTVCVCVCFFHQLAKSGNVFTQILCYLDVFFAL